jgi:ABC-type glycerol-3-phosphate transport system substrate-binding protein
MIPQLAPSKALRNLGPLASRDKLDLKAFFDAEIKARTVGGALVALPAVMAAKAHILYWNKAAFRRAGLDPEKGPKTWTEAQELALKLTSRQATELERLGIDIGTPPGADVFTNQFVRWLYHNGGQLFSDDARKVVFNDPLGQATIEWMHQTVTRQGAYEQVRAGAATMAFYRGDLAMTMRQDNFPSEMKANELGRSVSWGVTLLPVNDKNNRAKVVTPAIGGHGYGVPTNAKNLEGGWALTKFLTASDAACQFITKEQGRLSPLRRCAEIPEASSAPEFKVFTAAAEAGVPVPNTIANGPIATILRDTLVSVYEGKASPKSALDEAARAAQIELDKAAVIQ